MNTTDKPKKRRTRFQSGLTPGGELWNIPRASIEKLRKFQQPTRIAIIRAAILYFVKSKPGNDLPQLDGANADAMLRELITGEPVEIGVR